MPILKSNSSLIILEDLNRLTQSEYNVLNFVQSISINASTKRLNQKYIGDKRINQSQFVKPEIELSISYLNRIDFYNELLFGFSIISSPSVKKSFANNLINNFSTAGAFILMSDIEGKDLFYQIKNEDYNIDMVAISFGDLFLKTYSISYRVGGMPIVNCSFLSSEFSASKLIFDSSFKYKTWDNKYKTLNTSFLDQFEFLTNGTVGENVVLHMKDFSLQSSASNSLKIGPEINSLLDGLIQSIDISIDINRNDYYFFEGKNIPSLRKILMPITCNLKIEGISKNFKTGDLETLFSEDNFFDFTISLGKEIQGLYDYCKLYFTKVKINNFSYSIDLQGFLNYTVDCIVLIDDEDGFKINLLSNKPDFVRFIYSSDNFKLSDEDENTLVAL